MVTGTLLRILKRGVTNISAGSHSCFPEDFRILNEFFRRKGDVNVTRYLSCNGVRWLRTSIRSVWNLLFISVFCVWFWKVYFASDIILPAWLHRHEKINLNASYSEKDALEKRPLCCATFRTSLTISIWQRYRYARWQLAFSQTLSIFCSVRKKLHLSTRHTIIRCVLVHVAMYNIRA